MNKIEPTYLRYIYDGLNKGLSTPKMLPLPMDLRLFEEVFSRKIHLKDLLFK